LSVAVKYERLLIIFKQVYYCIFALRIFRCIYRVGQKTWTCEHW